jgi:hypothetical protein
MFELFRTLSNRKYLFLYLILIFIMMIISTLIIILNSNIMGSSKRLNSKKIKNEEKLIEREHNFEKENIVENEKDLFPNQKEEINYNSIRNHHIFNEKEEEEENIKKNNITEKNISKKNNTEIYKKCKNTKQSKIWTTDNDGYVCKIEQIEKNSNCCSRPNLRFSCSSCNKYGCCLIYEMCVSCCMSNDQERVKLNIKIIICREIQFKINLIKEKNNYYIKKLKHYLNIVQQGNNIFINIKRCRTNSKSVIHENSYKTQYKHCYDHLDPIEIEDEE